MKRFPHAHATHPQWRMAAALVLAQLRAQMALPDHAAAPPLGLIYITDRYADDAQAVLDHLCAELPEVTDWVGTTGIGIAANNAEYFDEGALAVMLCDVPVDQYRVFSGVAPLLPSGRAGPKGFVAHTALIHADPRASELEELITEMADRTTSGQVFGGLSSGRGTTVQFAMGSAGQLSGQGACSAVLRGGLSGVAFSPEVALVSRVTQGAQPLGPTRTVTDAERHVVYALDGEPALDVLLRDLAISLDHPEAAIARVRRSLVGMVLPDALPVPGRGLNVPGQFGPEVMVRHLVGLDPERRGVAIASTVPTGTRLTFCERHANAARADLMRMCAEIREELETESVADEQWADPLQAEPARPILGAIYISCAGRGGPLFGQPNAEMQIVRHALGDVPLVGFFASGEIAHRQVYGYSGVLTVFVGG
jgi:small ligand-binding sensory domain FIST